MLALQLCQVGIGKTGHGSLQRWQLQVADDLPYQLPLLLDQLIPFPATFESFPHICKGPGLKEIDQFLLARRMDDDLAVEA